MLTKPSNANKWHVFTFLVLSRLWNNNGTNNEQVFPPESLSIFYQKVIVMYHFFKYNKSGSNAAWKENGRNMSTAYAVFLLWTFIK